MPEGCLIDFVKQFASSGTLDEHLLRTFTRSIVEGIDYLHSKGIVHCDIKGKNILVGNGAVKLTDFGSSKRVGDAMATEYDSVNCGAKVNGTPLWMAPEVVRQVEQGPASDIWSLGCTVLEMATGRAPWSNFNNHFVALYHIGCTDELPEVPASLSAEAHDFLSHCFQRDPSKRWTSSQLLQHPFLTTRFVAVAAPPCAPKAPASPVSVMHFPADSDSDASFVHSVPTLAAPSLFKRGLVCAQPKVQEQVEDNWWSTPDSPDSGPWIVVKSPKSSPSSPSFVVSDIEAPLIEGDHFAPTAETESTTVAVSAASPFLNTSGCQETPAEVGVSASDPKDTEIVARDACVAISETDFSLPLKLADSVVVFGNHAKFFVREKFSQTSDEAPSTSLNFGRVDTISEYSEQENVYSFSNPQILLYWLHRAISRDFECLKSGHSNHCILLLDEYSIIPVQIQTKQTLLAFLFVCMILTCSLTVARIQTSPALWLSKSSFRVDLGLWRLSLRAGPSSLSNGWSTVCKWTWYLVMEVIVFLVYRISGFWFTKVAVFRLPKLRFLVYRSCGF